MDRAALNQLVDEELAVAAARTPPAVRLAFDIARAGACGSPAPREHYAGIARMLGERADAEGRRDEATALLDLAWVLEKGAPGECTAGLGHLWAVERPAGRKRRRGDALEAALPQKTDTRAERALDLAAGLKLPVKSVIRWTRWCELTGDEVGEIVSRAARPDLSAEERLWNDDWRRGAILYRWMKRVADGPGYIRASTVGGAYTPSASLLTPNYERIRDAVRQGWAYLSAEERIAMRDFLYAARGFATIADNLLSVKQMSMRSGKPDGVMEAQREMEVSIDDMAASLCREPSPIGDQFRTSMENNLHYYDKSMRAVVQALGPPGGERWETNPTLQEQYEHHAAAVERDSEKLKRLDEGFVPFGLVVNV